MGQTTETYKAATHLINQYGDAASEHAEQWLAESLLDGDKDSSDFWQQVIKTLTELQSQETPSGVTLH